MTTPRDEGVVKYRAVHANGETPRNAFIDRLDEVRTQLFDWSFIGVYPDGVGYGNVSIRSGSGCIISGTATGGVRTLGLSGYCAVVEFNLRQNTVHTLGPVPASSEAMTHCAIYAAGERVNCVLHIHNYNFWRMLLDRGATATAEEIAYGTPEMAEAITNCVQQKDAESGLIVMAGHEEGIVAYGATIETALNEIETLVLSD